MIGLAPGDDISISGHDADAKAVYLEVTQLGDVVDDLAEALDYFHFGYDGIDRRTYLIGLETILPGGHEIPSMKGASYRNAISLKGFLLGQLGKAAG